MHINGNYPCHPDNCQYGRAQKVEYLVYHYVGALGSAEQNARYYHSTPGIGASAHYFVDHGPDAEVYASVGEHEIAWHCGRSDGRYKHPACRNANSIGIEMCCHKDGAGRWYIDPETIDRAVELGREIMDRYGIPIDRVLRHYDVTGKICPAPMVDDPAAWEAFKSRLTAKEGETHMSKEELRAMVEEAVDRALSERDAVAAQSAQRVSLWAAEHWDKAVGKGVFDGTRPGGALTREQAAVAFDRLGLLD